MYVFQLITHTYHVLVDAHGKYYLIAMCGMQIFVYMSEYFLLHLCTL